MVNYNPEDIVSHDGIAAVIKNSKGEILMQEHAKYGFWTIPVGKVKQGQSIEEALKEEIFEECNITITECQEVLIRAYNYERNGNHVSVKAHLFEILKYSGEIKNNEPHKHSKQLFIDLGQIKKLPYLSDLTLLYLETIGIKRKAHLLQ